MPVLTTTASAAGNREDLIPLITMISPEDTPFLSAMGTKKATGTKHEWLTDVLAAPVLNAVVEGAAAFTANTSASHTPRVRVSNTIQNIRKIGSVSDNQEAVLKAGIKSEYSYQLEKATKEIARDTERAMLQGTQGTLANGAPLMQGLFSFTQTNQIGGTLNAGGTAPAVAVTGTLTLPTSTTVTLTAGHGAVIGDYILIVRHPAAGVNPATSSGAQGQYRRISSFTGGVNVANVAAWDIVPSTGDQYKIFKTAALTTVALNSAFQTTYEQGGNPNCIFAHPSQKIAISNLANQQRRLTGDAKKIGSSIDIYESPFGVFEVALNRWMPLGSLAIIEKGQFAAAYLRPVKAEELARVGSSRDFMIESAVTLEARAENASALMLGLA